MLLPVAKPSLRGLKQQELNDAFAFQLKACGFGGWVREAKIVPGRKYQSDFYWKGPPPFVVEIEGGQSVYGGGHHQRANGFEHDILKYFEYALLDVALLRFNTKMVRDGRATSMLERYFQVRGLDKKTGRNIA